MKVVAILYGIGGSGISGGILYIAYGIKTGIPHSDITFVIFGITQLLCGSFLFWKGVKRHDKIRDNKFWHKG